VTETSAVSAGRCVLVTGATGGIGQRLVRALQQQGYQVRLAVRSLPKAAALFPEAELVRWEAGMPVPETMLQGVWGIVNLAGAPIARRWTAAYRQEIFRSRVETTRALAGALSSGGHEVQVFLSVSATGYYGDRGEELCTESTPAGRDFLAQVCAAWEAAAQEAASRVRVVIPRLGIVLDRRAGFLPRLMPAFRFFVGGTLGNGQQWVPWVHWSDVVGFVLWALRTPAVQGVYNVVAPQPVRFRELCQLLGRLLRRPCWLSVPGWVLRLRYGALVQALLSSQRVIPHRAHAEGFRFQFPELEAALRAELSGETKA